MVVLVVVLSFLIVVAGVALFFAAKLLTNASEYISIYEEFFDSTISDFSAVEERLNQMMKRRQFIADDPDIQEATRLAGILHDIVVRYIEVGGSIGAEKEKKKKKE